MKIQRMTDAINYLRITVGEMGIQQLLMLITIMEEEGITQIEIAERFDFQQGSVSKNCKKLSRYTTTQRGQEVVVGMDLIKLIPDPKMYRRLGCWLTARGKQIKKELLLKLGE